MVEQLRADVTRHPHIAELLALRGVNDFESAKNFFRPTLDQLHDPYLMLNMDKAVNRVAQALGNGEKILVYGDYDVDGTTSVALVYSVLCDLGQVEYYIPDRYTEGYGLSMHGMEYAASNGFSLIIALDCGIRGNTAIAFAQSQGVDVIVCDHHLPGPELPPAFAILDPKQEACPYPYKELCGCGVGFKLMQALIGKLGADPELLMAQLPLVALAIGADIVPITGENRVLAYFGLKRINEAPLVGISALLEGMKLKKSLSVSDVVFLLGPRINAAGRIKSGRTAVELLTSTDLEHAKHITQQINELNRDRREFDKTVTEEALHIIKNDPFYQQSRSTVVWADGWHKGVVGIVASRLIESYFRPTIVLTHNDGFAVGSARSVPGFDVHEAIAACADLLDQYGGHKYAAGLKLRSDRVDEFRSRFEAVVASTILPEMLVPTLHIDREIALADITPKFFGLLAQFAPFGPGNMNPIFVSRNVELVDIRTVGTDGKHLKLLVCDPNLPRHNMPCIAFNLGHYHKKLRTKMHIDIAYTIGENEYRDQKTIQLEIKDIKFREG